MSCKVARKRLESYALVHLIFCSALSEFLQYFRNHFCRNLLRLHSLSHLIDGLKSLYRQV